MKVFALNLGQVALDRPGSLDWRRYPRLPRDTLAVLVTFYLALQCVPAFALPQPTAVASLPAPRSAVPLGPCGRYSDAEPLTMADIQNAYNQMNTPFPALAGFAGGNTSTAPALAFALHEFSKITSPASTRVLLLFTDGIANRGCLGGIDAVSLGCSVSDLPYSIAQGQMASQIQLALKQGIRVFVIGFGAELTDPKNAVHMGGKTGEQVLVSALNLVSKDSAAAANPALKSGLYCAADDPVSLQRCFDGYASDLLRLSR